MKLRHLWLPMLLLTLIGGAAKICDTVFTLNGSQFFIDSTTCNFIFVGALVLLFIIGFVLNIFDRKVSVDAEPVKNIPGGVFGFISSVTLIGSGVISILGLGSSSSLAADLLYCILTLLGGAILLFESCILFTGHNSIQKTPVLALAVPLWGCARLISLFIAYTKVSIQCTEMFDIISVALLVMFLFYQSMLFAQINKSTAAKKLIVYGLLFIMSAVVVTIDLIIKRTTSNELTISNILSYVCDISFCGYAICLISDILKKSSVTEDDEEEFNDDISSDNSKGKKLVCEASDEESKKLIKEEKTDTENKIEPVSDIDEPAVQKAAEPATDEPVIQKTAEPVIDEHVIQKTAEPAIDEPVIQKTAEPAIDEPVIQKTAEPAIDEHVIQKTAEPAIDEHVIQKTAEPVIDEHVIQKTAEPDAETINKTEKQSQDNAYDEIFRLLDEISSNNK